MWRFIWRIQITFKQLFKLNYKVISGDLSGDILCFLILPQASSFLDAIQCSTQHWQFWPWLSERVEVVVDIEPLSCGVGLGSSRMPEESSGPCRPTRCFIKSMFLGVTPSDWPRRDYGMHSL
jgi:hypothetical protein